MQRKYHLTFSPDVSHELYDTRDPGHLVGCSTEVSNVREETKKPASSRMGETSKMKPTTTHEYTPVHIKFHLGEDAK